MEQEPKPGQPDNLDQEAAKFFKEEEKKTVGQLQEALHIDQVVKRMVEYIEKGFLTHDMPLIKALEKLEKKKFELIEIDPEEAEEEND